MAFLLLSHVKSISLSDDFRFVALDEADDVPAVLDEADGVPAVLDNADDVQAVLGDI